MRSSKNDKKTYYSAGAVAVLLLFFHYLGWAVPIENAIRSAFLPISKKFYVGEQSAGKLESFFSDRAALVKAAGECQARVAGAEAGLAELKSLQQENGELRKQLGFQDKTPYPHVPAEVVGKNTDSVSQIILVNQGSLSGIKVNDPVVSGDGILVGKISKTEETVSFVRLLADNESRAGALILNKNQSQGILEGGFGLSLRMIFIPRNETVMVGDKVMTSGLENGLPRGLYIGNVAVVENEPYEPFQQAVITPAVDLSKLLIVNVLLTIK